MEPNAIRANKNVILIIIVASLGYFVDIYDLVIFSIVRVQSFHDIGIAENGMRKGGEYVLNMQMGGLLIGGIIWGIIGDKFGRIKVLFGSIVLYSFANIANAYVGNINSYAHRLTYLVCCGHFYNTSPRVRKSFRLHRNT